MKKILYVIAAAAVMCSCSGKTDEQKLSEFVEKVNSECQNYTSEDWEKAAKEFSELSSKINVSECSAEELENIQKSFEMFSVSLGDAYESLSDEAVAYLDATEETYSLAAEAAEELSDAFIDAAEELSDAASDAFEELGNAAKAAYDDVDIDDVVDATKAAYDAADDIIKAAEDYSKDAEKNATKAAEKAIDAANAAADILNNL